MKENIRTYFSGLTNLFSRVSATNELNQAYPLEQALDKLIRLIITQTDSGGRLLFIGNGGSAAIASHMAVDFWKNAGRRAFAFNDSSLLTCVSNDYGFEHVFEKPIEMFADAKDILFAISSSGRSENILRGAAAAREKGLKVITLSGFDETNPLRKLGGINFYVPSASYGFVEIAHLSICHCVVDAIIEQKNG